MNERQSRVTGRELVIARLSAQGMSDQRIARELSVAPSTVRNHMTSLCRKLGGLSRFMCGALAERLGLLRPGP